MILWQIGDKYEDFLKWKNFRNKQILTKSIESNKLLSKISDRYEDFNEFKTLEARIA